MRRDEIGRERERDNGGNDMERDVRVYGYTGEREEGAIERRGAAIWKEIYEEMIMKEKGKRERDIRRDEFQGERAMWERDIGKGGSAMEVDMRRDDIGRERGGGRRGQ